MGYGMNIWGTTPFGSTRQITGTAQPPSLIPKPPRSGLHLSPFGGNPELTEIFLPAWGVEGFSFEVNSKAQSVSETHGEIIVGDKKLKGRKTKISGHIIEDDYWGAAADYLRKFAQGNYALRIAEENVDVNGNVEDLQLIKTFGFSRNYKDIDTDGKYLYVVNEIGLEKINIQTGQGEAFITPSTGSYTTCAVSQNQNIVFVLHDTGTTTKLIKLWIEKNSFIILKEIDLSTLLTPAPIVNSFRCDIDNKHIFITASNTTPLYYVMKIDIDDLTLKASKSYFTKRTGIAIIDNDIVAVVKNNGEIDIIGYADLNARRTINTTATGLSTGGNHALISDGIYVWTAEVNTSKIYRYTRDFSIHDTNLQSSTFNNVNGISVFGNRLFLVQKTPGGALQEYYANKYKYKNNDRILSIDSAISTKEKYVKGNVFKKSTLEIELFSESPFWNNPVRSQEYFIVNAASNDFAITLDGFIGYPILNIIVKFSPMSDLTIKYENTNRKITLKPTTPFALYDVVQIDTGSGTIKINGIDTMTAMTGNFFELSKGINYFRISSPTTSWSVGIHISFADLYL